MINAELSQIDIRLKQIIGNFDGMDISLIADLQQLMPVQAVLLHYLQADQIVDCRSYLLVLA